MPKYKHHYAMMLAIGTPEKSPSFLETPFPKAISSKWLQNLILLAGALNKKSDFEKPANLKSLIPSSLKPM